MLVICLGVFTQSIFGFGLGMITMSLLALFIEIKVATPLIALVGLVSNIVIVINSWKSVVWSDVLPLVIGVIMGIPFGLIIIETCPRWIVTGLLGLVVIIFSLYALITPQLPYLKYKLLGIPIGIISGSLGSAYNTSGPPAVIYGTMRRWPGKKFRGSMQGVFLPSTIFIVASHGIRGWWNDKVLTTFAIAVPLIIISFFIGNKIYNRITNQDRIIKYIYIFLVFTGSMIVLKAILLFIKT